jgi:hypothetical protein
MKNMGTVTVNKDPVGFLRMDITGQVRPPVDYQNLFPAAEGFPGKDSTVQTRADDQKIIFHANLLRTRKL